MWHFWALFSPLPRIATFCLTRLFIFKCIKIRFLTPPPPECHVLLLGDHSNYTWHLLSLLPLPYGSFGDTCTDPLPVVGFSEEIFFLQKSYSLPLLLLGDIVSRLAIKHWKAILSFYRIKTIKNIISVI